MKVSGIIAELSNAHNGSLDRAHRIIDAVKKAGADWLKFQCYTPSELVELRGNGKAPDPWGAGGWTMRDLYEKAQTPHAWFPELVQHCADIGLPWFSSVFGPESLDLLERLDCPAYKIASLDSEKVGFIEMVWRTGKPLIQSLRVPPVDILSGTTVLYCPRGYPQDIMPSDVANAIREWADGFSFHGTDRFMPSWAIYYGARLVECHVQLDDEPSELEANVSLTMSQLSALVSECREEAA